MAALRHALAMGSAFGQFVSLDQGNALEVVGQHARRAHPTDASADHYNMIRLHLCKFTSRGPNPVRPNELVNDRLPVNIG